MYFRVAVTKACAYYRVMVVAGYPVLPNGSGRREPWADYCLVVMSACYQMGVDVIVNHGLTTAW